MNKLSKWITDHFYWTILIILALKFRLSYYCPITSDEAYFWQWGKHLALTFYDHPFMTGIWVYLGQAIGEHIFFPRMISNLGQILIFVIIYKMAKSMTADEHKAKLVSLLYLCSPAHFLFFVVTTDSPLFLFAFFVAISFYGAIKKDKALFYVLIGIALGLSLFSKYLIFFLGLSVFFCLFLQENKQRILFRVSTIALGFLPFLLFHFYVAKENCWWPLQFNVFNRPQGKEASFMGLLEFALQQLFLLGPFLAYYLIRRARDWRKFSEEQNSFIYLYLFSLSALGAVSVFATGLHWGLSLYSFIYLGILAFKREDLERSLAFTFVFCILMNFGLYGLLSAAPKIMASQKYNGDYVMGTKGDKLHLELSKLALNPEQSVYGTLGYTTAGIMEYHSGQRYLVFNDYDTNGRNDDYWTDYRKLDGKDFIIISTYNFRDYEREDYKEYFQDIEYKELSFGGANFYVFIGKSFIYSNYQAKYLTKVNEEFYQFKTYLPAGRCFFKEKYFE